MSFEFDPQRKSRLVHFSLNMTSGGTITNFHENQLTTVYAFINNFIANFQLITSVKEF